MRLRAIVNKGGGAFAAIGGSSDEAAARIRAAFAALGAEVEVLVLAPAACAEAFAEAARAPGIDAIVAGGGDGTISCAAGALAGSGRALGILPLGTLNHLARDAGIPADLEKAAEVVVHGRRQRIDLAEVNGHVFVNNSAVGLYPDMVRFRDAQLGRNGGGKRLAMLSASLRALRAFRRHRLWISAPGLDAPIRTPLLFLGNNRYQVSLFALGRRETLDRGELCLYAVRARSRAHLLWAGLRGLIGRLDQQRDFITAYVTEAEIDADRAALTLSADGETLTMQTPLNYRILPGALTLIVPAG